MPNQALQPTPLRVGADFGGHAPLGTTQPGVCEAMRRMCAVTPDMDYKNLIQAKFAHSAHDRAKV